MKSLTLAHDYSLDWLGSGFMQSPAVASPVQINTKSCLTCSTWLHLEPVISRYGIDLIGKVCWAYRFAHKNEVSYMIWYIYFAFCKYMSVSLKETQPIQAKVWIMDLLLSWILFHVYRLANYQTALSFILLVSQTTVPHLIILYTSWLTEELFWCYVQHLRNNRETPFPFALGSHLTLISCIIKNIKKIAILLDATIYFP